MAAIDIPAAPAAAAPDQVRANLYRAGLFGGLVMVVFMLVVRGFSETESLVEIVAGVILQLMPIDLFSFTLQLFKGWSKPLLLGSVILGTIAVGGWITRFDGGAARQMALWRKARRIVFATLLLLLPFVLFALLATSTSNAVALTSSELISLVLTLTADFFVFTLASYLIYPVLAGAWPRPKDSLVVDHPPESPSRRTLIAKAATGAVALAGVAYVGRFVLDTRSGKVGGGGNEVALPITPNDEFYQVSKNFVDPNVGLGGWELQVTGLVNQQMSFTYSDLTAMPSVEQMATLTCISNEIGGDLIGNAVWTGVRLSDILAQTGINPITEKVAFFGADGYSDSFELSKALEPSTIVAYLMNGEQLPDSHGFPARLIVPGKYGIKNGKWLRRMQLVTEYRGYWQERGWTNVATIKTMSRFDVPGARAIVPLGPIDLGGVAFAGDRGIQRVEYSTDDGATWIEADELQIIGPLSWAIWRAVWTPAEAGAYELRVRATDGTGEVQTSDRADPVPDGASGHHQRVIGVTS